VQQDMLRTTKANEENYLLYLRKQEEARISDALDHQRISNVLVAEAATVPFKAQGQRLLFVILGILFACLASVMVGLVIDRLDPSFRTPEEVQDFLGSPVLALFRRIVSDLPCFWIFFGLREQPFGVSPDPKYLYFSPSHREALASLFYGIETGRGFLALIAEPGMGKTSLLFQLLERLKGSIRSAFLFQTQCDSRELLRYLLEALGVESGPEADLVQLHSRLNQFLLAETAAGRRVVVFIDEGAKSIRLRPRNRAFVF